MEKLSVIIVTFNTREWTLQAIESALAGDDGLAKEILVVDNGSEDGTEDVVRHKFPEVIYHYSERNLGFARANNLAVAKATGDWVLLLNSDARLKPGALRTAMDYLRSHPECGVLGAQLLNPDESRQNSIASFPSLATELFSKSLLRRLFPKRHPGKEQRFLEPTQVDSVIGAFFLVPRKLWKELGGLDEGFFFFLEETDFCLRAQQQGWGVIHHPGIEVWHGQGGSAGPMGAAARIEYWRSRYRYFRKHFPQPVRAVLFAGLMLRLILNWLLNGLGTFLTLGQRHKLRQRFAFNHGLLVWHLLGCPERMGLPR